MFNRKKLSVEPKEVTTPIARNDFKVETVTEPESVEEPEPEVGAAAPKTTDDDSSGSDEKVSDDFDQLVGLPQQQIRLPDLFRPGIGEPNIIPESVHYVGYFSSHEQSMQRVVQVCLPRN